MKKFYRYFATVLLSFCCLMNVGCGGNTRATPQSSPKQRLPEGVEQEQPICPGGDCPDGNCPGDDCPDGNCPGDDCPEKKADERLKPRRKLPRQRLPIRPVPQPRPEPNL